jgi:hypothetical protein
MDEQGSKLPHFYALAQTHFEQMKWQIRLQSVPSLYFLSEHLNACRSTTILLALVQNLIITLC